MYLISENNDGNLSETNLVTKNNVKNWINQYRSLNDQIEILNPKIINFDLEFTIDKNQYKSIGGHSDNIRSKKDVIEQGGEYGSKKSFL